MQDLPVTPATVRWRLTASDGTVLVPWAFAADFAITIPANHYYWHVYAAGTHENFVGRGPQPQLPGAYTFRLTPPSAALEPGRYTATVVVSTANGNRSTQRLSFRVLPSASGSAT